MIYRRLFNFPSWGWRSPFEELDSMRRRMDLLSEAFGVAPQRELSPGVFPLVNITESKESFILRAELPGVKGEDLDIQATGKNISLSGERQIASEGENIKYHRREREAGKFSRIVSLPGEIDSDKVKANLTDGVLTVVMPKAETIKPKQIAVS